MGATLMLAAAFLLVYGVAGPKFVWWARAAYFAICVGLAWNGYHTLQAAGIGLLVGAVLFAVLWSARYFSPYDVKDLH